MITRRSLLKGVLVSGGIVLTGCETRGGAKTISIFGTGTLDVQQGGWAVLERDLKNQGFDVSISFQDNGNDVGPVINSMLRGSALDDYQIGALQGGAERELAESNLIAPWDTSLIPNWANVWPTVQREIETIRHEGLLYSIPVVLNADSIIYLPDEVSEPTSYADFFEPDDVGLVEGRLAMEDSWLNSVIFTALYLRENGIIDIENPSDLTESELAELMEWLIEKRRELNIRLWNGWQQGVRMVTSKEVVMMTGWEPIVYAAIENGVQAKYAAPREGYDGWYNGLILHRTAAEDEELRKVCHAIANWMLGGFYSCEMATARGYMVPVKSCPNFVESGEPDSDRFDLTEFDRIYQNVENKIVNANVYWQNVRPTLYHKYDEWWSKLRAAV